MPFSGSAGAKTFARATGSYSGATAWQQTEAGGRDILSLDEDIHDQDMAAAISTSWQINGDNTLLANLPCGGYGLTGLGVLASAADPAIASAATTDLLGSAALINSITGTASITSLGTGTYRFKIARFTGAATLTHHATSLILPGAVNILTANGDTMGVVSDGSSNARVVWYQRAVTVPAILFLASGTISSAATLDIVMTSYTSFRGIQVKLGGMLPATDNVQLYARFSTDGGSNYDATGYNYNTTVVLDDAASPVIYQSGSANQIVMGAPIGNAATEGVNFTFELLKPASATLWTRAHFSGYAIDSNATPRGFSFTGGGAREAAQNTDALRFLFSAGNIASGDYAVYGLV